MGEDVFSGEEPFFDALGETAFDEDGSAGFGCGDEELEVLAVAGADLEDVSDFCYAVDVVFAEDFGDDAQAGEFFCFCEETESFWA